MTAEPIILGHDETFVMVDQDPEWDGVYVVDSRGKVHDHPTATSWSIDPGSEALTVYAGQVGIATYHSWESAGFLRLPDEEKK